MLNFPWGLCDQIRIIILLPPLLYVHESIMIMTMLRMIRERDRGLSCIFVPDVSDNICFFYRLVLILVLILFDHLIKTLTCFIICFSNLFNCVTSYTCFTLLCTCSFSFFRCHLQNHPWCCHYQKINVTSER